MFLTRWSNEFESLQNFPTEVTFVSASAVSITLWSNSGRQNANACMSHAYQKGLAGLCTQQVAACFRGIGRSPLVTIAWQSGRGGGGSCSGKHCRHECIHSVNTLLYTPLKSGSCRLTTCQRPLHLTDTPHFTDWYHKLRLLIPDRTLKL